MTMRVGAARNLLLRVILAVVGMLLVAAVVTPAPAFAAASNRTWTGSFVARLVTFEPGTFKLVSPNGTYTAIWQSDANFVVYHNPGRAVWSSNTIRFTKFTQYLALASDGGILIKNHCGPSCMLPANWGNNYHDNSPDGSQYNLVMQSDGNLVEYADGKAVWATNTVGK